MSSPYLEDGDGNNKKITFKEIIKHPVFIILAVIVVIGVWFGISFVNIASNPTEENSINYYGVAKVMKISEAPSKCFVHIKREDGRETKQRMSKADCRKLREGDMINLENGQYVSTVEPPNGGR
jgi:hypothetical protein